MRAARDCAQQPLRIEREASELRRVLEGCQGLCTSISDVVAPQIESEAGELRQCNKCCCMLNILAMSNVQSQCVAQVSQDSDMLETHPCYHFDIAESKGVTKSAACLVQCIEVAVLQKTCNKKDNIIWDLEHFDETTGRYLKRKEMCVQV